MLMILLYFKKLKGSTELINTFDTFPFSWLKVNQEKCENAGNSCQKGGEGGICEMKCIDLMKNTKEILSIYFFYNTKDYYSKTNHIKTFKFQSTKKSKNLNF